MRDQYIFDIPIYRKTKDDFNNEIKTSLGSRVGWIISHDLDRRPLKNETYDRLKDSVIRESGGPWQFNQIIGWLRLFVEGNTIGGHFWWIDAKRLNRKIRYKRLYLTTPSDVLQAWFPKESSTEIFDKLLNDLTTMAKEPKYKKHYFDLDVFRRIGPFIDWRDLINSVIE